MSPAQTCPFFKNSPEQVYCPLPQNSFSEGNFAP
jgi:hypothetical protein